MTYYCRITRNEDGLYEAEFPDVPGAKTCAFSEKEALMMAKDVLDEVLETDLEHSYHFSEPVFKSPYAVEVDPRIGFAIMLRAARGAETQQDIAVRCGMTAQQYQRLENPRKANPTVSTLARLEKALGRKFLAF